MTEQPGTEQRARAWLSRFEIASGESSLWPAGAAIAAACLWVTMPVEAISGLGAFVEVARWLVPAVTFLIVLPLVWVVVAHPVTAALNPVVASLQRRRAVYAVIVLIVGANTISIVWLVHLIVNGTTVDDPHDLIRAAMHMWATNVVIYALWFWQFDGGGPVKRHQLPDEPRDFLFPQTESPQFARPGWSAQFIDYLYLSFTNSVAFSPTDALPLKRGVKMLMLAEASMSLLLLVMVAARAVNVFS